MKVRKLIESFNYAIAGIIYVITTQRNMKIHVLAAVVAMLLGLWVDLTRTELLLLLFAIALVLVTEMLNTAIEAAVDLATTAYHPLAKIAKNVAAGAVLISALTAVIVGYELFFDKANPLAGYLFLEVRRSPINITVIGILVLALVILLLKAYALRAEGKKKTALSGISALAFAAGTAIAFITDNAFVASLSFFIAFLVAHSRLEAKFHTFYGVVAGAVLGVLVTILFFQFFG